MLFCIRELNQWGRTQIRLVFTNLLHPSKTAGVPLVLASNGHGPLTERLMDITHNNANSFLKIPSDSTLMGWLFIISGNRDALSTAFNQSTGKQSYVYRILVLERFSGWTDLWICQGLRGSLHEIFQSYYGFNRTTYSMLSDILYVHKVVSAYFFLTDGNSYCKV